MYTNLRKYIAASCAFLLVSFLASEAKAVTASEDEMESTSSEESRNTGTIELDVPSYLVRYLYREPDADQVAIKHWYDGWGWSMYWNPDVLAFGATSYVNKFNMSIKGVGLAISKDFNKYSAIRLGANFSSVACNDRTTKPWNEETLKRANVSLDYLWNLSNTYYGYDLHRTTEWLLTGGVKAGKLLDQGDMFYSINLGAQFRKNISNDWSFFIEPQFAFFTDRYDNNENYGSLNIYEVDPGANLLVGLYFRMGQPKMQILEHENDILGNSYFQAYAGAVNGNKTFAFKTLASNDYQSHHMNFGFNIGSWFNPSLGFRLGYFENIIGIGNNANLKAMGYDPTAFETYRGGRAEIVLNPLTIMTDKTSFARFGLDLSVGYEVGTINKHNEKYDNRWTKSGSDPTDNHIDYLAHGITFATQLKYYLSKNYAIFAEGRYSNPMFSAKAADGLVDNGDLNEQLMSWAIGMEYYISTFDRYTRFGEWDKHESRAIPRLTNDNRWYVELGGGVGAANHWGELFDLRSNLAVVGALGINYNDYSGLRARFAGMREFIKEDKYVDNLLQGDTYQFTVGLDYMFNLTTLWWGRDENDTRWSDIYLFAGPTLQFNPHDIRKTFKLENAYGGEVGAQFTRRLSSSVDFFVEPRYEYNIGAANRWNVLAGLKLYQYREKNRHYRDSLALHDKDSWFMEVSGGAGLDVAGTYGTIQSGSRQADLDFRLGFGYRMNPISSLRFNVQAVMFSMFNGNENGKHTLEVSFDYMANLLNLWYGNNPHRKLALYGYLGPVISPEKLLESKCTVDLAYDWKLGMESGLQLVYSPFQNVSLFVEPRVAYFVSDYIKKSGAELNSTRRDEHMDVYAGMIFHNQPGRLPLRGYRTTDLDSTRTWYYEMAGGVSLIPSGHKGDIMGSFSPTGYIGIGHYFSNFSSLRARLSLNRMLEPENYDYKIDFITGTSLDYMYNLSNRLLGVNPYRRFDFSLYGGPVAEYYNSELHKYDEWDFGANFGGQLAWHVNNYVDFITEGRFIASTQHHTRYEALAGFKLYQNKQKTTQFRDSLTQHAYTWFMETAGGIGKGFTDEQKVNDGTGKIAFGYRYNPISSLRIGAGIWGRRENKHLFTRQEISLDYMANLFNVWYGVNPFRRVNMRAFVGPSLTFDNFTETEENLEVNASYQAGIQVTVGLAKNVDLLLEPRYSGALTGSNKNTNRGDMYAGLIFYNQRGLLPYLDYNTVNVDSERGWYLETAAGLSFISDGRKQGLVDHINPIGHIGLGRYFNDYSSARLRAGLGYNRYVRIAKQPLRWYPEISLDYLHNMTNVFLGVNPYRRFDFSLFAGPMLQVGGMLAGNIEPNWGVNGGGQLAWHANNFVDFFAEPRVTYLAEDKYYSRFEALAGVRVYQNKTRNLQYLETDAPHANTWFMEMAGGAGTAFVDQTTPDMSLKAGFGYRYNPYSSLRFTGHYWARHIGNELQRSMELSVDYMANVLNILYGVNPERRLALRGFVGGNITPENFLGQRATTWLVGLDFGGQATYKLTENIDFLVEPRIESYLNSGHTPRIDAYAGLIFYNQRGLLPMRDYQSTDIDDHFTWFSEFGAGMSFNMDGRLDSNFRNHFDIGAAGSVGMHFNNYASARFRGSLVSVRHADLNRDGRKLLPKISFEYMHNLTNSVMGYNPYRRFDVNIFAGPAALLRGLSHFHWDPLWGVDAGGQLSWHMNDRWDMFGELRASMSHDFDSRVESFGGIAYRYNKRTMRKAHYDIVPDHMYMQILLGTQLFDLEHFGSDGFHAYNQMPSFNYNFGYRLNKMLGLQAGIFSDHFELDYLRKTKSKKAQTQDVYSFGVRAEGTLNIINMFSPSYDANEERFNWNATAGIQLGRTRSENDKMKYGYGLTAATQLQYRVMSHSWVLAEFRAQAINGQRGLAVPMTAQLGMMYDFNQHDATESTTSNLYVQAGAGAFESKAGMMSYAVGYDFSPVNSIRLATDISTKDVDKNKGKWVTLSPDYICNLTNLFWGHDENNHHVDFSTLAGVDFYLHDSQKYVGVNAGVQLNFNINKNWQIYAEPRLAYSFSDEDKCHEGFNLHTMFGLKYHLPDFLKK